MHISDSYWYFCFKDLFVAVVISPISCFCRKSNGYGEHWKFSSEGEEEKKEGKGEGSRKCSGTK